MKIDIQSLTTEIDLIKVGSTANQSGQNESIELDSECQSEFITSITRHIRQNKTIIIDLEHVIYIDASGLWALFDIFMKITKKKGKFIIVSPTESIAHALDASNMTHNIPIRHTLDEAIKLAGTTPEKSTQPQERDINDHTRPNT